MVWLLFPFLADKIGFFNTAHPGGKIDFELYGMPGNGDWNIIASEASLKCDATLRKKRDNIRAIILSLCKLEQLKGYWWQ